MTIQLAQQYTAIRIGSNYYISASLAPHDAEIAGVDEILHAQTDYSFSVETDQVDTITDNYGTIYEKVIDSIFRVNFIASLPPYVSL